MAVTCDYNCNLALVPSSGIDVVIEGDRSLYINDVVLTSSSISSSSHRWSDCIGFIGCYTSIFFYTHKQDSHKLLFSIRVIVLPLSISSIM